MPFSQDKKKKKYEKIIKNKYTQKKCDSNLFQ